MDSEAIQIALIDDDSAVLDALRLYFERQGVLASCFLSVNAFLAAKDSAEPFDCIVADVRMPGMSGLDLVRHLAAATAAVPVILISGHGDIEMAVRALKLGVFDFLEKPFDEARLFSSIHLAIRESREKIDGTAEFRELRSRMDSLSERQRQVMEFVAAGLSNKEIATKFRISPRTVENHRAWMMERMGARNIVELVNMITRLKARS
jgi:two-component system response regulator FixJ